MYHMAAFLLPDVPVYEIRGVAGHRGMLVSSIPTGAALARTLGDRTVVLMRGHGAVVVGSSIPDAVSSAIFMDANARAQAAAIALGGSIAFLTEKDVAPPLPAPAGPRSLEPPADHPRSWPFWKARAMNR
jgi:HCOMODA/2-hydroxy-3-carboxy-muconic semialdehyde decarboxylase